LTLYGLAFVIVLTMISGARELMTPGAWRKQGWTYKLADTSPNPAFSKRAGRQRGLEQLRNALWRFAALNSGRLPDSDEPSIAESAWEVPGCPGLRFMSAGGNCRAEESGRLYVFEPDIDGNERLVLLTNGFIGTMSSDEIRRTVAANIRGKAEAIEATGSREVPASMGENE